ncbi:hypothetical protein JCM10908_001367 [Rhodotorula pacifica]|uniref:uncharacterized protein n=1 Tax=Rhodotorula pacifica TaxID=1495444 RepID=UPI0031795B13
MPPRPKVRHDKARLNGGRTTLQMGKSRLVRELKANFRADHSIALGEALVSLWGRPFQLLDSLRAKFAGSHTDKVQLQIVAELLSRRYGFLNVAKEYGWEPTVEEQQAAEETLRFANEILDSPALALITLPASLTGPARRTYSAWPVDLLYLISLYVCGLERKGKTRGTDWQKNKPVIDAAVPGLADRLQKRRDDRKAQLSQQRYNSLSIIEASAWFDWLAGLASAVKEVAKKRAGETGKEGIRRAADLLGKTSAQIELEVQAVVKEKERAEHPALSDEELSLHIGPELPPQPDSTVPPPSAPYFGYEHYADAQNPFAEWPHGSSQHIPTMINTLSRSQYGAEDAGIR